MVFYDVLGFLLSERTYRVSPVIFYSAYWDFHSFWWWCWQWAHNSERTHVPWTCKNNLSPRSTFIIYYLNLSKLLLFRIALVCNCMPSSIAWLITRALRPITTVSWRRPALWTFWSKVQIRVSQIIRFHFSVFATEFSKLIDNQTWEIQ